MTLELSALGWTDFFDEQWKRWDDTGSIPGRIAAEHRGAYEVWSAVGSGAACISGRLRHEIQERENPGVGDWVALDAAPGADRIATIQRVLERRTSFTRGCAGRESREQVIAANVDVVFVVCGLDNDFNIRRLERYVARVWGSGALPIIILSKADLSENPGARIEEVKTHTIGVEVLAISALRGEGLAEVRARIGRGMTAALVGSSGAGKSTIVNALVGEETMATGAVRPSDSRGRHVTTHRQLVLLPGDGLLLDTPGMRELQISDESGLSVAFEDVIAIAERCRFTDCAHGAEPGCAVQAAVLSGELDAARLAHYLQLQREARAFERRHDARLRHIDERAGGRLTREANREVRRKRGN